MSRIMIAGTGSNCGKTSITCGILKSLKDMGKNIISFKCGPDFIDPMFHKKTINIPTRNLDIFLMGKKRVCDFLKYHSAKSDISVIEGVMGIYDGIGHTSIASSNHLSLLTKTPVVLVVNAKGKSKSICAEIEGYLNYMANNISGIILNNISEKMYDFYKNMIEDEIHIKVLGFLPTIPEATIGSRHLGLVTANEIKDINKIIDILTENVKKYVDLNQLINIANSAEELKIEFNFLDFKEVDKKINIYVANDNAFCFFYEDNHLLLKKFGANIKFFSPLKNEPLPDDADGLILWGGYPEIYAQLLSGNKVSMNSIKNKIEKGLPVYAESGGFIYLQEALIDSKGGLFKMMGVLEGEAQITKKLNNFGYVELKANSDNILCKKNETVKAHSFHYSSSTNEGNTFIATKQSNNYSYPCIVTEKNIFASFFHIHFFSNINFPRNFIKKCIIFQKTERNKI